MSRNLGWLLVCVCSCAYAQYDATVLGTVKDATGSMIPNSKVTLSNLQNGTRQNAVTDANGHYEFLKVRLGEYTLKAEAPGFKVTTSDTFTVTVNAVQRVDLTLEVGQVSENITVTGVAAALETDSSNRSQVITNREIVNLPLNGRSYADLTLLVPGVRKSMIQNQTLSSREASYNVNGQRAESNNFVLDGVDNNAYGTSNQGFSNQVVQITPDAVAEYRVETNNFSAEYGHASGAVINVAMKSGTNQLHGSAWEFLRNTSLNAVGFFKPVGGKPVYQQNQFGGSAGFAVKKDKLFFFGDYEGQRRTTRTLQFATVPTADQRAGRLGAAVMNPLTGALYSDGVIPEAVKMKSAINILNALPQPNLPGISNNFQSLPKGTLTDDKGDFRIDYYAGSKLSLFARYSHRVANIFDPGNIPGPAGGNNNGNVHIFNQQVVPGLTYSFNSSTVLEARAGVGWTEGGKTPIGLGEPSLLTDIPNLPTDKLVAGSMNSQSVQGFSQFGRQTSNPQFQNPFAVNPRVSLAKFLGRHTLKTGYEMLNLTTTIDDFNPAYGNFNYTGQFSRPAGAPTSTALSQAYGLTDFFAGAPSHYELNNLVVVDYRQYMHFLYFQDDWKVNNRLTLNLGMRYEFASPQWVSD
ncbi:MAG: TonB-dependent receptor, partial [Bryobacterales bacterium]|nr:TonB-dependent receptor [Bryobacterales bacterium]